MITSPNAERMMSQNKMKYSLRKVNRPYTSEYRIYFEQHLQTHDDDDDEKRCPNSPKVDLANKIPISPFHDIPLYHDKQKGIFNMVVEIPRWSQAKFEISRSKRLNPIIQDELDGHPRFVKNCFPYKGYIWNYGALPQTWEDPSHLEPTIHTKGDNDPIDACEISPTSISCTGTGTVKRVKALGILCLIDSGETDWKVIVIDVNHPLASKLHDIDDVDRHFPGLLDATRDWFKYYKVPDGNKPNEFGYGGRFLDKKFAEKIIGECEQAWKRLIQGKAERGDVSIENTTLEGTPGKLDPGEVDLPPGEDLSPAPIEEDLNEWVFLDKDKLDSDHPAAKSLSTTSSLHIDLQLDG
ncbi:putative inorganic pyrophosphatase [Naviculisporaceae sp. PSN 640]